MSGLDFYSMVNALKKGMRARRPHWKEEEFIGCLGNILVHNTFYWSPEIVAQFSKILSVDNATIRDKATRLYPYVCELSDIGATDWIIIKN